MLEDHGKIGSSPFVIFADDPHRIGASLSGKKFAEP